MQGNLEGITREHQLNNYELFVRNSVFSFENPWDRRASFKVALNPDARRATIVGCQTPQIPKARNAIDYVAGKLSEAGFAVMLEYSLSHDGQQTISAMGESRFGINYL
jgi:hypothetical protein